VGSRYSEGSAWKFLEAAVRVSFEVGVCLLASASVSCKSATSSLVWDIRDGHFGVGMLKGLWSTLHGHVCAKPGCSFYKSVRYLSC